MEQAEGLCHQTGKWHMMPLSRARTMDKSFQMSAFVVWAVSWLYFEDSSKNRHKGILNSKGGAAPYSNEMCACFLIFGGGGDDRCQLIQYISSDLFA